MTTNGSSYLRGPGGQTDAWQSRNSAPRQFSLWFVVVTGVVLFAFGMLAHAILMRIRRQADPILVSVNGTNITRSSFVQRMEMAAGPDTLHAMINDELQLQFAQKKGVTPDEKEVEARFARAAKQPDFLQHLFQTHQSPELVKRRIRVGLATAAVLSPGVEVTEAEVRQYYQAQIAPNNPSARYYTPETVRIQIIVTQTKAQAQTALDALNAQVPFEEIAARYSIDNSRASGGHLPPWQRGRTRLSGIAGLEAAIFALKVGAQWGPRRFGTTLWIVRCLDKTPAQTIPYKAVEHECRTAALIAKAMPINGRRVMADYAVFKRHATLQAFDPSYESVVNAR